MSKRNNISILKIKSKVNIILVILCSFSFLSTTKSTAQSAVFTGANQVTIGDLDITGNQITVEALAMKSSSTALNIVSKHLSIPSVNYLFRFLGFGVTTTSGANYYVENICYSSMLNDVWYHVAGTYDGITLKYYLNGCLVASRPATGNLVNHNFNAVIGGRFDGALSERWRGNIDEVRIWNVARTQAQISANINSLPTPTAQVGLQAYYKFNGNLINAQGNATWNAVGDPSAPSYTTEALTIVPSTSCICNIFLPIELTEFTSQCVDNFSVKLNWTTASELNNAFFTLEKSTDAINWQVVSKIEGAGNSQTKHNYSYNDVFPPKNTIVYYRLKQTDFDGSYKYSAIITANDCIDNKLDDFYINNPISNELIIKLSAGNYTINVFNSLGVLVYQNFSINDISSTNISQWANGLYYLQIQKVNGTLLSQKIIKE